MASKFLALSSTKRQRASASAAPLAPPQVRRRTSSADVPAPGLENLAKLQALQAQPLQTVAGGEGSATPLVRKKRAREMLPSEEVNSKSPPPPIVVDSEEGSQQGRQHCDELPLPFKLAFSRLSIHEVVTKVRSSSSCRVERAVRAPEDPVEAVRKTIALAAELHYHACLLALMMSLELEGRDLKEEETNSSYERRIAELEVAVDLARAEKEAEADRSKALIAHARNDLKNARGRAETAEKGWSEAQQNLASWAYLEKKIKKFPEFDGLARDLADSGFYYALNKLDTSCPKEAVAVVELEYESIWADRPTNVDKEAEATEVAAVADADVGTSSPADLPQE